MHMAASPWPQPVMAALLVVALLTGPCRAASVPPALRPTAAKLEAKGAGTDRPGHLAGLLAAPMASDNSVAIEEGTAAALRDMRHAVESVEREVKSLVQQELGAHKGQLVREVALTVEAQVREELLESVRTSSQERVSRAGEAVMEGTWVASKESAAFGVLAVLVAAVCRLVWLLQEEVPSNSALLPMAAPVGGADAATAAVVDVPGSTAEEPRARIPLGVPSACGLCLLLVPFGSFAQSMGLSATAVFWLNLLAIVPESFLICVATEELAFHLGDTMGALLNASFGNAVEIIFAFLTLKEGLLDACAGAIVGSILSNQLVLLGLAFLLAGALCEPMQLEKEGALHYDSGKALEQAQQLLMAAFSVALPSAFARLQSVTPEHVLVLTRGFSVILLLSYVALLVGQLRNSRKGQVEESHRATLTAVDAMTLLAAATAAVSLSSKCLVESLQEFCTGLGLSYGFVGMVLLPVAGDFSHISAVYLAMKGKMDLAIHISLASASQNALVIAPFSVVLGHFLGQPMTLGLQPIYGVVLLLSATISFAVLVDGRSSWLRGYTLLTTYALVCLVIFFSPDVATARTASPVP